MNFKRCFQSSANFRCQFPRFPNDLTMLRLKSNCHSIIYTVSQSNRSRYDPKFWIGSNTNNGFGNTRLYFGEYMVRLHRCFGSL